MKVYEDLLLWSVNCISVMDKKWMFVLYMWIKPLILVILSCLGLSITLAGFIHHVYCVRLPVTSGASRPILEAWPDSLAPLGGNPQRLSVFGSLAGVIQTRHQISLKEGWRAEGRVSSAATRPLPEAEDATINIIIDNLPQRLVTASQP